MSDSKELPDNADAAPCPSRCYRADREYHDAAKWYLTSGDDMQTAIEGIPPVNSSWSDDNPDLICTELEWGQVPQTFFDWLFRRPKRWWVIANFDKSR